MLMVKTLICCFMAIAIFGRGALVAGLTFQVETDVSAQLNALRASFEAKDMNKLEHWTGALTDAAVAAKLSSATCNQVKLAVTMYADPSLDPTKGAIILLKVDKIPSGTPQALKTAIQAAVAKAPLTKATLTGSLEAGTGNCVAGKATVCAVAKRILQSTLTHAAAMIATTACESKSVILIAVKPYAAKNGMPYSTKPSTRCPSGRILIDNLCTTTPNLKSYIGESVRTGVNNGRASAEATNMNYVTPFTQAPQATLGIKAKYTCSSKPEAFVDGDNRVIRFLVDADVTEAAVTPKITAEYKKAIYKNAYDATNGECKNDPTSLINCPVYQTMYDSAFTKAGVLVGLCGTAPKKANVFIVLQPKAAKFSKPLFSTSTKCSPTRGFSNKLCKPLSSIVKSSAEGLTAVNEARANVKATNMKTLTDAGLAVPTISSFLKCGSDSLDGSLTTISNTVVLRFMGNGDPSNADNVKSAILTTFNGAKYSSAYDIAKGQCVVGKEADCKAFKYMMWSSYEKGQVFIAACSAADFLVLVPMQSKPNAAKLNGKPFEGGLKPPQPEKKAQTQATTKTTMQTPTQAAVQTTMTASSAFLKASAFLTAATVVFASLVRQ